MLNSLLSDCPFACIHSPILYAGTGSSDLFLYWIWISVFSERTSKEYQSVSTPRKEDVIVLLFLIASSTSVQSRYGPDYYDYGRKTSEFGVIKFDLDAG